MGDVAGCGPGWNRKMNLFELAEYLMPSESLNAPRRPPCRPRRVGCGVLFAQSRRLIPQRLGRNRNLLPDSTSGLAAPPGACRADAGACSPHVTPNLCLSSQADSPGDGFDEGRQVGAEEGEWRASPRPSGSAPRAPAWCRLWLLCLLGCSSWERS